MGLDLAAGLVRYFATRWLMRANLRDPANPVFAIARHTYTHSLWSQAPAFPGSHCLSVKGRSHINNDDNHRQRACVEQIPGLDRRQGVAGQGGGGGQVLLDQQQRHGQPAAGSCCHPLCHRRHHAAPLAGRLRHGRLGTLWVWVWLRRGCQQQGVYLRWHDCRLTSPGILASVHVLVSLSLYLILPPGGGIARERGHRRIRKLWRLRRLQSGGKVYRLCWLRCLIDLFFIYNVLGWDLFMTQGIDRRCHRWFNI